MTVGRKLAQASAPNSFSTEQILPSQRARGAEDGRSSPATKRWRSCYLLVVELRGANGLNQRSLPSRASMKMDPLTRKRTAGAPTPGRPRRLPTELPPALPACGTKHDIPGGGSRREPTSETVVFGGKAGAA